MAAWPQLDPVQQNELLGEITGMMVAALAPGWHELMIDYRVVGRNIDIAVGVLGANNEFTLWDPPVEALREFQRLRGGMYRQDEGTWFSARYTVIPPSRFSIQYNWRNQPDFESYPPPAEFALEQERFPRAEAYRPDWYRAGLAAAAG
nr:hypothetical protein [Kibdelosporangium sp. MJ126-NF4]CEL14858.1 hypothetical protein [Kibdelosporangium sp. MJ126-NF4]CTQ96511.1 hypothetical protein [Kibdelosporangium sp. MJ126-NF4]